MTDIVNFNLELRTTEYIELIDHGYVISKFNDSLKPNLVVVEIAYNSYHGSHMTEFGNGYCMFEHVWRFDMYIDVNDLNRLKLTNQKEYKRLTYTRRFIGKYKESHISMYMTTNL